MLPVLAMDWQRIPRRRAGSKKSEQESERSCHFGERWRYMVNTK